MSENEATTGVEALPANVIQLASRALQLKSEPYLTDPERAALRKLIALLPRLEEMERQFRVLATACPTARRELSDR